MFFTPRLTAMSTVQRVILGIFSHVVKVCGGHEATVLAGLTLLPVTAQCDRGQANVSTSVRLF